MHTVMFKAQCFVLEHSFLINPVRKMNNSLQKNFVAPNCPCSSSLLSLSYRIQPQRSIISCARKNKRRSGSQRSRNFVLKMVSIVALNLKIIPQPLDLVIGEFVGDDGNGGDLRILEGWRRKRKLKLLPIGFIVIFCWGLLSGRILEDSLLRVLGFFLSVIPLTQWSGQRRIRDWVLRLFLWSVLVSFGLRKEDKQNWVERLRVYSPIMHTVIGKVRKGGRHCKRR